MALRSAGPLIRESVKSSLALAGGHGSHLLGEVRKASHRLSDYAPKPLRPAPDPARHHMWPDVRVPDVLLPWRTGLTACVAYKCEARPYSMARWAAGVTSRVLGVPGLGEFVPVASVVAKVMRDASPGGLPSEVRGRERTWQRKGPGRGSRDDRAVDPGSVSAGPGGCGHTGSRNCSGIRRCRLSAGSASSANGRGRIVVRPSLEGRAETTGWSCRCPRSPGAGTILIRGRRPNGSST